MLIDLDQKISIRDRNRMELLSVITAVKDCASYIRGNHVIVECDH